MPFFQVDDNTLLTDSTAIARHLIRQSQVPGKADSMLGTSSPFAEAKVEQFIAMASASVQPHVQTIEATTCGQIVDPDAHAAAVKALKETCKVLNAELEGKAWLCGSSISFADIHMFTSLASAF